jgi:hypothetical protein
VIPTNESPKQPYEAPVVRVLGSLSDMTLGGSTGRYLDADFPRGTDYGDLTFSA